MMGFVPSLFNIIIIIEEKEVKKLDKRKKKKGKKTKSKKGKMKKAKVEDEVELQLLKSQPEKPKPIEPQPTNKDFRDLEYPTIQKTREVKEALMSGLLQVVNSPYPLLIKVSELRQKQVTINGEGLDRKKIYKIVEG